MSEKTLTVVFAEAYNLWIIRLKGDYAAHEKATEKGMEAVAAHARKTDPVKAELVEALTKCRTALGQLATGPVHYYLDLADKALASMTEEGK